MKPKVKDAPPPPQPAPEQSPITEDAEAKDPVVERRRRRASLKRSYLTAPASPGVGVQT